ncbi:putative inorganic phosphate cotransporter [Dendroctonus ponderosae]|uniref:Putative inorganic phosphate cotransporter n=1 Tax=Dendroctonus ponderosae TaxID=77166 RepID=A0AAR5P3I5_DENPD|nr:putative inorganic phosphate cotransporter [Dendroctonus ponderosae]
MANVNEAPLELADQQSSSPFIKVRYIQVVLLFFMLGISFSIRICLSVAIVAMTSNSTSSNPDVPYYDWGNSNIILSSFYWSYAILQFVAGNFVHWFGTKKLILVSIFANSVTCALIPLAAKCAGANGVMVLRVIQGLFQGFLLPCMNGVLGRWLPPTELSYLTSIVFSGYQVGAIASTVITGYFSASHWGWPAAFYLFAALGFVWCIFWAFLSAETPATHPSITKEERKYIEHSLGQQDDHLIGKKSIPWSAILKSVPYWAIIIAAIGESWSTTFLSAELPSYLSYAIGLDIQESSLFSAAPVVGALIGCLCYSPIAGYAIKKGYITTINSRRFFQGFSMFSVSIGFLLLPYIVDRTIIAVVLIGSTTAGAAVIGGHIINHLDLSPRYAAILSGISNGIGQLIAIFAPILVHFIVTDQTDARLWGYTFVLSAIVGISTTIFFIWFCSGERQWWDEVDKKRYEASTETPLPEYGKTNPAFSGET